MNCPWTPASKGCRLRYEIALHVNACHSGLRLPVTTNHLLIVWLFLASSAQLLPCSVPHFDLTESREQWPDQSSGSTTQAGVARLARPGGTVGFLAAFRQPCPVARNTASVLDRVRLPIAF